MDKKYLQNLIDEFHRFGYEDFKNKSYKMQLLYLFAYYHYFDADSSKIDDIIAGDLTNKTFSDYIDGIYIDENSDMRNINVIISAPNCTTGFDQFLYGAESLYYDALSNCGRDDLMKKVEDKEFQPSKTKPIEFIVITDFIPTTNERKIIQKQIRSMKSVRTSVSYRVIFGNEIESEILEIENPKEYVEYGNINIDDSSNVLCFGKENSLIVNASALSIKKLYLEYGYRGLFSQNLRYYVKNAKIDESIQNSIQNRPDEFWYFNNGIIIVCDDYKFEDDKIRLTNFSIINGGQTTYLIGETDFTEDFYLQCKIIKSIKPTEEEKVCFISDVAEASNTQKPIKAKDLIANRKEQRMLKTQLSHLNVFCSIKRGQKVNKKIYPEPWQNTNNEEIGQFIYSYMYQQPGKARNNKAALTSDEDKYALIFKKTYDSSLLTDLLKMKMFYKLWVNKINKDNDQMADEGNEPDTIKIGLAKNGMLFMFAIVGLVSKLTYHPEYLESIDDSFTSEQKVEMFSQFDISHRFVNERFCLDKESWFVLFDYCYSSVFLAGYNYLQSFKPSYSGYSNFTKTQLNYDTYVLGNFIYQLKQYGIPKKLSELISDVLYIASDDDKTNDRKLLHDYVNSMTSSSLGTALPEALSEDIKQRLIDYRTKTYKNLHIKAYEVFTNRQLVKISKFGPATIEDLKDLKVLDQSQLETYGDDIVEIINNTKLSFIG